MRSSAKALAIVLYLWIGAVIAVAVWGVVV